MNKDRQIVITALLVVALVALYTFATKPGCSLNDLSACPKRGASVGRGR